MFTRPACVALGGTHNSATPNAPSASLPASSPHSAIAASSGTQQQHNTSYLSGVLIEPAYKTNVNKLGAAPPPPPPWNSDSQLKNPSGLPE
jgi:hypothetical protein